MKKLLFISTLLILFLFSVSFAQENVNSQSKRLAFVNKAKFEDQNGGIEKLVQALQSANELQRNPGLKVKIEISEFLKQIESQNNVIILDIAELDRKGQITLLSPALDVTHQVVSMANEYFKTNTKPTLNLNLVTAKIASVKTKSFLDEKSGIRGINEKINETKSLLKNQIGSEPTIEEIKEYLLANRAQGSYIFQLLDSMQSFAEKNDFNVVLDSSQRLPAALKDFQIQDITKDFISYYNQVKP